jgi:molybdate transport system regulatory protein
MSKPSRRALGAALFPRLRVSWRDAIALGPGKVQLLALIRETGSIRDAAERMRMSYMRAWLLIRTMNQCFKGPLVKAVRGGRGGGGAELTPAGNRALELYQRMEKAALDATQADWRVLRKLLRDTRKA